MASGGKEEPRRETPKLHDAFCSSKPKILLIMGPTAAGKSKFAIDLASHFLVEVINADSMQELLVLSPNIEFTAKRFKDAAIQCWRKSCSPFLFDNLVDDKEENCSSLDPGDMEVFTETSVCSYEYLKELDPVIANRIHTNDHRKGATKSWTRYNYSGSRRQEVESMCPKIWPLELERSPKIRWMSAIPLLPLLLLLELFGILSAVVIDTNCIDTNNKSSLHS